MKQKRKRIVPFLISFSLVLSGLFCGSAASSVQAADASPTLLPYTNAEDFANCLLGSDSGFTVSGAAYTGKAMNLNFVGAIGKFSGASSVVGFNSGIVLSTGFLQVDSDKNIFSSGYTADYDSSTSGAFSDAASYKFNPNYNFNDVSMLQFDLTPTNGQAGYVSFQYCVASEEYPEYLNFADQFVLDVNGTNYALIPNTSKEVSIGTVNDKSNSQYYKGITLNSAANAISTSDFIFDGETVVFSVTAPVNAGANHVVLAIADKGDQALDSAVFIKAASVKNHQAQPGTLSFGGKTADALTIERTNGTDGDVQADVAFYDASNAEISTAAVSFGDGESQKSVSVPYGTAQAKLENAAGGAAVSSDAGTFDFTALLPTFGNASANVAEFTETAGNLAGNITGAGGLAFSVVTQPSHGTLTLKSDGTYTYKPNANYTGTDSFTYKAVDQYGNSTNTATVAFSVSAASNNPDKSAVTVVPSTASGTSATAVITPDIVSGLSGGDNICVELDGISANIPVTVLTGPMGDSLTSTLKLTRDETPADTKSKAVVLLSSNGSLTDIFDLDLTRYYSNGNSEAVHQLNGKVKITLALTDAMLASIKNAATAGLYYFDTSTGKLVDMKAAFDLENKTVTFYTDHFSTYLIEDTAASQNPASSQNPVSSQNTVSSQNSVSSQDAGVNQNTGTVNPKTGDDTTYIFPLFILSALCVLAAAFYGKKHAAEKSHQR